MRTTFTTFLMAVLACFGGAGVCSAESTALLTALEQNRISVVRSMLEMGVDPNHAENCGGGNCYPLVVAVQGVPERIGHEMVQTLLNFGADPNLHEPGADATPLLLAVAKNDPDLVVMLLNFGAEANVLPGVADSVCTEPEKYRSAMDVARAFPRKDTGKDAPVLQDNESVIQALSNHNALALADICAGRQR